MCLFGFSIIFSPNKLYRRLDGYVFFKLVQDLLLSNKNIPWLKHLLENPSHFKSHISSNHSKRNALRSIVACPVITPWDIDHQMHCCMQTCTVPGCRWLSEQYDSDRRLHFSELLEILLNLTWLPFNLSYLFNWNVFHSYPVTMRDTWDLNKPAPWGKMRSDRYGIITGLVYGNVWHFLPRCGLKMWLWKQDQFSCTSAYRG